MLGHYRTLYMAPRMMPIIEAILEALEKAHIELQPWHPESAPGQFEFVLPPLSPLVAVDTLLMTREVISAVAAQNSLRATFVGHDLILNGVAQQLNNSLAETLHV